MRELVLNITPVGGLASGIVAATIKAPFGPPLVDLTRPVDAEHRQRLLASRMAGRNWRIGDDTLFLAGRDEAIRLAQEWMVSNAPDRTLLLNQLTDTGDTIWEPARECAVR